jgi:hypothetical protein
MAESLNSPCTTRLESFPSHQASPTNSSDEPFVLRERFKTPIALLESLPRLFRVASLCDVPRPMIRDQALALLASHGWPAIAPGICLH